MTVALAGYCPPDTLKAILLNCRGEYVISETMAQLMICEFTPKLSEELVSKWDKGRVFAKDFEIRWEREDDQWHFLYIGEDRKLMAEPQRRDLSNAEEKRSYLYLWGEREENEWIEQRIPRILVYPVAGEKGKKRVVLEQIEYWNRETGGLLATRFSGISEVSI